MNQSIEELIENILSDQHNKFHSVSDSLEAILALIQQEQLKLLERIEGEAGDFEEVISGNTYSTGSGISNLHRREVNAVPLKAIRKLKAEINGHK